MKIVLFGPPGAGKGSVSEKLSVRYTIPHISTGNMLREQIAAKTKLGQRIEGLISLGRLVDDETINAVVEATIQEKDGYILDGYPRNLNQVEYFERKLEQPDCFVYLHTPEDILIERLLGRGRQDDTEDVVKARLEIYQSETLPVLKHLKRFKWSGKWNIVEVDGVGDIETVTNRVVEAIDKSFQDKTP